VPAPRLGVASGGSKSGVAGRHKVPTLIIRATCPVRLLRSRGSDRRTELQLIHGSGQPLSTARWPTGKSPARALRIGHSQGRERRTCPEADQSGTPADATPHATRLVLPASALNMIGVSESSAEVTQPGRTRRQTGRLPQFSGTQRHSPVRGRTADQRSRRMWSSRFRSITPCLRWADSGAGHGWAPAWWDTRRWMFRAFGDLAICGGLVLAGWPAPARGCCRLGWAASCSSGGSVEAGVGRRDFLI
jgi:hypothetical protein